MSYVTINGPVQILSVKTYMSPTAVQIRVKLRNITMEDPTEKFDITQIPSTFAVEMKNRFELLDTAKKKHNVLWQEI